jgi:hypothetical protein
MSTAQLPSSSAEAWPLRNTDLPSLKTQNGVATIGSLEAAWFKDPSGNLLAVTSSVAAMRGG